MSDETIVAIYDTPAHAELAAADLREAGIPESAISVHAGTIPASNTGMTADTMPREQGFWSSLFGGEPDHDTSVYDRSVSDGASIVTVKTPEAHVTRVTDILESHNPIDIDDRATTYGTSQTAALPSATGAPVTATTPLAAAASDNTGKIQLAEERLSIGKRVVNRGGARIRRFVVERPVEEDVHLHTEKVVVERRPVTDGRPATDSFSDKTIEMMETSEEAVVSKTAHVYEEVGLRKEASERVETVKDTVRKEEVEVETIPGAPTAKAASTLPRPPIP